ncbi:MAG: hypothetical protein LRZ84_00310 [Desertifilum sp.]|nr:hypothetical protein [Desertifilum sp.]
MCISCLLFSTLTLFMPVTEAANPAPNGILDPQPEVSGLISAQESRSAIASLLRELPDSPEMSILRSELKTLKIQLGQTNSDREADLLLETGLRTVSERVLAEPSADLAIDALTDMLLLEDNQPETQQLGLKMLQTIKPNANLLDNNQNWGWVQ